ncbi:DUF1127 domain-containing protein [Agrobacterium sp. lyk4-40-TYG-31]|jgi:uncharacterized protein YjiS (DUF1127 family)|uniref:DUF1127 domain-containing protein n=1 Tax=Agrobacterium sp. lyk4-40-TYG-31 TaxID=3040276 RepID=UPI000DD0AF5E|nr:DUF1127 domain-containing protein [Agrobacterium sp. lyk4-40-TYG-31]
MTMITTHSRGPSRVRLHSLYWLSHLVDLGRDLHASWRRRQSLRALEALPAETLKDIGWPSSDNKRMRIAQK